MNSKRVVTAVAAGAAVVMGLSACGGTSTGGGSNPGSGGGGSTSTPAFNAALTSVFNASEKKGGVIKLANADKWDSVDPGDTYYGYSWNFARLYGRALVMFKPGPGKASQELVPDLAESLGVPSDGGKTWTYKLRKGVKYEDGSAVTSKDVKYAVLRSTDKEVLPNGPSYLKSNLAFPEGYKGPYKDKGVNVDSAIETPDDQTIVFHLKKPFGGFDYFAMLPQTVPVPEAKDTGKKYKEHVVSTGPYKFDKNEIDKGFTLVRNDQWDASTDPNRKALPDGYEVSMNVNADDIDNRLIQGDLHLDVQGTGVQAASLSRVLGDPALKATADNPSTTRLWYTSINPTVAPLDKKACREAVLYATDRTAYQTAFGGQFSGGDIATQMIPPSIPGSQKFDLYPAGADNKGDVAKAKEKLAECGQPDGFETNIAYRSERPREKATAEALQQALGRVGIKLTLKAYPGGDYFAQFAGNPPYTVANKLGLAQNGWQADWADGYGFLAEIVDSRVIRETGGSTNFSVRVPEVDTMLDAAIGETDKAKREADWGAIDKRVMEEAVILPGVHGKSLLLRGKGLTNVFVSEAFGQYDYLSLGVQ
ncbi:ABC transporter substrate-binding protein [Actinokineospora auranticolor]|uniref:Peptide/nickel transport system substrate-binding protein n=1 Tax=Actinokineospora auranticolor TaxID=155976 RepID=A0A2S6GKX6_9PSEU|nr:ABC transporter substrate-binding protein [Actinokineospora auranticolor]PPK65869.1 peptide/nickel transport system substrate-binding protein [Actinokineospora auranticolor]